MKYHSIILFVLILSLLGCGDLRLPPDPSDGFHPPRIQQPLEMASAPVAKVDSFRLFCPRAVGKFPICDTLFLGTGRFKDSTNRIDCLSDKFQLGLEMDGGGMEFVTDYSQSMTEWWVVSDSTACYPVFLVNATDKIKYVHGKDGHVFALQEAMGRDGKWYPVEGQCWDFCGNGHWDIRMHPGEFFCWMEPKYQGNFKTQLRVRFQNDDVMYLSEPFEGTVQESQLWRPTDEFRENSEPEAGIFEKNWIFYGTQYPNEDKPGIWQVASENDDQ